MTDSVSKSAPVRVTWHAPLDRFMGAESAETLDGETTLESFLIALREREPKLDPFAKWEDKDTKPWGVLVLRGSEILKLRDALHPGDSLDMMVMVEGG